MLVAGGHITKAQAMITYASIVSRVTVRIALMITALNDLDFKLGNIFRSHLLDTWNSLVVGQTQIYG